MTLLQGEDGSHTAYFWVYLRDSRSSGDMSPPAVAFSFTTGRGGKHPAVHLAGYRGYLQADGYAGYNALYHDPKNKAPRAWSRLAAGLTRDESSLTFWKGTHRR